MADETVEELNKIFGVDDLDNDGWEDMEDTQSDAWKPNKGDILEGLYVGKKENIGDYGSTMMLIESKKKPGTIVGVWANKVLLGKFQKVKEGMEVRITYLGMETPEKGGMGDYHNWKVQARVIPMQEV